MLALLNFNNKINAKNLTYALKLDFVIWKTEVKAQKIDEFTLKIFKIVLASFLPYEELRKIWLFKKLFFLLILIEK